MAGSLTLTELAEHVNAVLSYTWEDELEDYAEQRRYADLRPTTPHIFEHMVVLDQWANNTTKTAEEYALGD